jgi:hypothetical protein
MGPRQGEIDGKVERQHIVRKQLNIFLLRRRHSTAFQMKADGHSAVAISKTAKATPPTSSSPPSATTSASSSPC